MKTLIKFISAVAVLFVVACGDDNNNVVAPDDARVAEFVKPSAHAICNFYRSYHLSMVSDVVEDSVRLIISVEGRTTDEIHELIEKNPSAAIGDFDFLESDAEVEQYCKLFNDTCFNAAGFGAFPTLDTIASISVVCESNNAEYVNESAVIEYNDIKKIVGIDDFSGKRVSSNDFNWHVSKPLVDFNRQTDNYLIEMDYVVIKFPAPKVLGDYYYTLMYSCTNGKEFVLNDTVTVAKFD
mgnify:CR=1 FL=1